MGDRIALGGLSVEVAKKDIKHVHLSVHPPDGRVRVAAPIQMRLDTLRVYLISKLGWIKEQQRKFRAQAREAARDYSTRESHYLWGKRYLLKVEEMEAPPSVEVKPRHLVLKVRRGSGKDIKQAVLEKWYRDQVRASAAPLLQKWERLLRVKAAHLRVRKMRTRWGSCNHRSMSILLNSDLAKKPSECLEYIVVHELAHLLEPSHNARFQEIMSRYMPHWQHYRRELNRAPLSFLKWEY